MAAVLSSCIAEDVTQPDYEMVEAISETPVEIDGLAVTKGVVTETSTGIEVIWGTSESIGVYGSNLRNVEFTGTNKYYEEATTTFKGGSLFSSPKYAYYPYRKENSSNSQNNVKGNLPSDQYYSTTTRKMNTDYKVGVYSAKSWSGYKFNFYNLLTFARIMVNADGTLLSGDKLEKVSLEVTTSNGLPRQLSGGFTMDLTKGSGNAITGWDSPESGSNKITLNFTNSPRLDKGVLITGYASVAPLLQVGDVIKFEIVTDKHIATFSRSSKAGFSPNALINYPLTLANFGDMVVQTIVHDEPAEPETPAVGTHPVLKSMKFTVKDNPGKILGRKLVSSNNKTSYTTRTEEVCKVDTVNHKISLYLPYFNDRTLVPVFDIPEGTQLMYEGGEIISGESAVDFATYKQVAVVNEVGDEVVYDIEFTNTGLPVVVVNQKSGLVTSNSGEYKGGSTAWYNATGAGWQPKDSDWSMMEGDSFMVYNADGTSAVTDKGGAIVEKPLLASTRVRGNVSQKMPKKPFAVKLDKKSGVLGMAPHKRWVLLANWSDRTLMRNAVAFDIANIFNTTFPNDGIAWNPTGQFVELVYNGVHVGNYYLCEQVKIDGGRLDIEDPYDKDDAYSGIPEDYGYLLESDDAYDEAVKFITKTYIPFQFKDDADGGGEMLSYVKNIVNTIDENLYNGNWDAAFETLDLASVVDFWLIQELTMNGEVGHPKSCYSYIDDGKLYFGPIWDFDWQTFPNISVIEQYYDNAYTGGRNTYNYTYTKSMLIDGTFSRSTSYPSSPKTNDKGYMWYPMLVKSPTFKAMAAERWNAVKGAIAAYADAQIPMMAAKIKKSEAENWSMWAFESGSKAAQNRWTTYDVGGGFKGDEAMTFDNAVSTLTNTINTRINGMSYVTSQSWPSVSGVPSYSSSSSSGSNNNTSSGGSWWDKLWK